MNSRGRQLFQRIPAIPHALIHASRKLKLSIGVAVGRLHVYAARGSRRGHRRHGLGGAIARPQIVAGVFRRAAGLLPLHARASGEDDERNPSLHVNRRLIPPQWSSTSDFAVASAMPATSAMPMLPNGWRLRALRSVESGPGSVITVSGPAGTGKPPCGPKFAGAMRLAAPAALACA